MNFMDLPTIHKGIIVIAGLSLLFADTASGCNTDDIMGCKYIQLVDDGAADLFIGFIPEKQLEEECAMLRIALNCALKPEFNDCPEDMMAAYKADKNVMDSICSTYTYAYRKSQPCFMPLHEDVTLCIDDASYSDDMCEAIDIARECVRDAVMQMPVCTKEDLSLMELLVGQHFSPYGAVEGCPQLILNTSGIAMPPTTTVTTPTTTSTTMETTSAAAAPDGGESQTEDGGVGRVRGATARPDAARGLVALGFLITLLYLGVGRLHASL